MSTTTSTPVVTVTKTKPRGDRTNPTTEYSALLRTVRDAGLLRRSRGFYYGMFGALIGALAATATGMVLLGHSWFQLLFAAALGLILTQFAFLAHEASHRQVFESGRANDLAGRMIANLFVGISYSWWMTKHSRHHSNPNVMGKDPDIERDFVSFVPEDAAKAGGLYAWFTKRQGYLFFPILIFEGVNLHIAGFRTVFGRAKVDRRGLEIAMLVPRIALYLVAIFLLLPPGMAFAFIGVQLAVFGVYMGASFAPNHKGMPVLPHDSRVDFLRRQVLTSRNIPPGAHLAKHPRQLGDGHLHGRTQSPGRTPPVPQHAPPAPEEGSRDRSRILCHPRHRLYGDLAAGVVRNRGALPQSRRAVGGRGPLRLPRSDKLRSLTS